MDVRNRLTRSLATSAAALLLVIGAVFGANAVLAHGSGSTTDAAQNAATA